MIEKKQTKHITFVTKNKYHQSQHFSSLEDCTSGQHGTAGLKYCRYGEKPQSMNQHTCKKTPTPLIWVEMVYRYSEKFDE